MEALLLLAVGGFIVWLIARSVSNRRLLVEAGRRRALAIFEIDDSHGRYTDWTRFDFESMEAQNRWDVNDEPGHLRNRSYALRRRDGGWEWKMVPVSWAEHMKWLDQMLADPLMDLPMNVDDKATAEGQRKKYADGPLWEPIPDEHAARIETAYQRYVRQG